jgi:hypothetical protein
VTMERSLRTVIAVAVVGLALPCRAAGPRRDGPRDSLREDGPAATPGSSAASAPLASVPFELHAGLAYVSVLVNGEPVRLVVDSAANHPALDLQKAVEIGLDVDRVALQDGANTKDALPVRVAENVAYRIGDLVFTPPLTVVYSFEFLARSTGQVFQGVLGGAFFRQFVVEVDYPKQVLRIRRPESFHYSGAGKVVPVTVSPEDLSVSGEVLPAAGVKAIQGTFSLDTGAGGADVVLWKTCTAGGGAQAAARDLVPVESVAFGGSRAATQGRLDEFRMGEVVIRNPLVRMKDVLPSPASRLCGNVGSGVFERWNVIFDAPHGRLILE